MATLSSSLAWEIPWREEPGGLQSTGLQGVGHNLATKQQNHAYDGNSLTVPWTPHFSLPRAQVQFLVGELNTAKKEKKTNAHMNFFSTLPIQMKLISYYLFHSIYETLILIVLFIIYLT